MTLANKLLLILLFFCFYSEMENHLAKAQRSAVIEGSVVYPDGSVAVGARVVAESICDRELHLIEEAKTNSEGKFSMRSFDSTCNKYKLRASYPENLWLQTGEDIFYIKPNGTSPTIELISGRTHLPILMRLEQQGGEIQIKVFDEKTQSYIYAGLDIERESVGNKSFGSMSTATGEDGSSHTLFLPPGDYIAKIDRYICHGKTYFSAKSPTFTFSVKAGERQAQTLKINIAQIQTKPSYDNPKAIPCLQ